MKRIVICLVFVLLFVCVANAQTKSITGKVVQVINSNAGEQVQIEVNGEMYQFGLGTINNRDPGIQITRAWVNTLKKLKRGDEVTIEYNELQGNYGAALRVRVNKVSVQQFSECE